MLSLRRAVFGDQDFDVAGGGCYGVIHVSLTSLRSERLAICESKSAGDFVGGEDIHGASELDRFPGHAVNDGAFAVLGNCHGAVIPHEL